MASTDSISRISGVTQDFELLTTGVVDAPSDANSAKVRVILTPQGTAPAVVFMDDISFRPAVEPQVQSAASEPAAAAAAPDEQASRRFIEPETTSGSAGMQAAEVPAAAEPSAAAQVAMRSAEATQPGVAPAGGRTEARPGEQRRITTLVVGVLAMLAGGFGLAVWSSRRSRQSV
jgi:hypothetical protein